MFIVNNIIYNSLNYNKMVIIFVNQDYCCRLQEKNQSMNNYNFKMFNRLG